MRKLKIEPKSKDRQELNIIVHDYWYRSASGFGSYTKEISEKTFNRVANNSWLYYTNDPDGNRYSVSAVRLGRGFYIHIKPDQKIYPQ